jgi:hypothetical protein
LNGLANSNRLRRLIEQTPASRRQESERVSAFFELLTPEGRVDLRHVARWYREHPEMPLRHDGEDVTATLAALSDDELLAVAQRGAALAAEWRIANCKPGGMCPCR